MLHLPLLLVLLAAPAQEMASKAPAADAKAWTPFQWKSAAGLRYAWCLPKEYEAKTARNLTVILHGTGGDYRWGFLNNQPGAFRPNDVVVSVDGTTPGEGESRLFMGEEKDAAAFRDFLAEMRTQFAVAKVFLYGHSQGGFFVTYYAGEFPDTVDGVVAHASGSWTWTKTGKKSHRVAVAFMHGTSDPVVPYGQSPGARDHYVEEDYPMVLLRRLPGFTHWPNGVRATECLDWCEAMTTDDPDRALALAKELLRPKGADEYQYEIPPAFAAARQVLRRFGPDGHDPFGNLPAMAQGHADEVAAAVEKLASDAAEDLQKAVGKKLALSADPPAAALRAYREDFRGVDAAERWIKKLDLDQEIAKQAKLTKPLYDAWYSENMPEGERFATIALALADCWLHDGLPPELAEQLDKWKERAAELKLDKKALKAYETNVEPWKQAWGADAWKVYEKALAGWKVPK